MGKTKKLTQYILPVPKGSKWAASSTSGRGNKGLGDRGRNSHEKDRWTLLEKLLDLQLTSLTQLSWWLLTLPWKIWALQSAMNKTEGFQAYCQQKNQLSEVCRSDLASLIFSQKVPELPIICLVPQLKYKQMTRFMKKDSNLKREREKWPENATTTYKYFKILLSWNKNRVEFLKMRNIKRKQRKAVRN